MTDGKREEMCRATGFAGLAELASDISDALESVERTQPDELPVPKANVASLTQSPTQSAGPYQGPKATAGGSFVLTGKGKVILGAGAVIAAIWLFSEWNSSTYTPAPSTVEVKPPVGSGQVLSADEIRYCLSENLRLDAAQGALNRDSQIDIDRFNAMVADYNSRCGNFRYDQDSLESVRAEVDGDKDRLNSEGAARFSK